MLLLASWEMACFHWLTHGGNRSECSHFQHTDPEFLSDTCKNKTAPFILLWLERLGAKKKRNKTKITQVSYPPTAILLIYLHEQLVMIQLMLGWHPAGTEDNHLSAKVIISYKWNRIRYSLVTFHMFHLDLVKISLGHSLTCANFSDFKNIKYKTEFNRHQKF